MKTEIAKIKFRRGLESERTGVIFDEGEPAYTVDTHRLFIGDGVTSGGNPLPLHWSANNFSQITNPVTNDIALINGVIYWYRNDFWQIVGGDNGGIGTNVDSNTFETVVVTSELGSAYDQSVFKLRFDESVSNPITADGRGIYLNYSNNFVSYDHELDIPFYDFGKAPITAIAPSADDALEYAQEGPIGLKYTISSVIDTNGSIDNYSANGPLLNTLHMSSSTLSFYYISALKPVDSREKDWKYTTLFLGNGLKLGTGTVKSLTSSPVSNLTGVMTTASISNLTSTYSLTLSDDVAFWYDKIVTTIELV